MKLTFALSAVPFVLALCSACSKPSPDEQKKQEDALTAAFASAMAAPASASASAQPAAGTNAAIPAGGGIQATCSNKGDGKCTESSGAEGMGADESCKRLGGVYAKGATPCARDTLVGTCTRADASSGVNDVDYYYKQSGMTADAIKSLCEGVMSGTWAAAPKGATSPGKGAMKPKK